MAILLRSKASSSGSDRVLIAAGLFFVCALLSALVGPMLGVLCFMPAVIAMEAGQTLSQSKSKLFDSNER